MGMFKDDELTEKIDKASNILDIAVDAYIDDLNNLDLECNDFSNQEYIDSELDLAYAITKLIKGWRS